jgi:hypothetical protein
LSDILAFAASLVIRNHVLLPPPLTANNKSLGGCIDALHGCLQSEPSLRYSSFKDNKDVTYDLKSILPRLGSQKLN